MSDLDWTVTAAEVEEIAAVLTGMAQNMRAGYMEAARAGDGFLFRITPRGEAYARDMTAGDEPEGLEDAAAQDEEEAAR
jgi:hypothetical protein